jgi:uncharacterized iron-regulated protein
MGFAACAKRPPPVSVPLPAVASGAQLQGRIVDMQTLEVIDLHTLIRALAHAQVIALGEEHYHPDIQAFELDLLRLLAQQQPQQLALAMEFLERDKQQIVDDYVAETIDQTTFQQRLQASTPFQRYYFPLVHLARQAHLPIIAMNIPRRIAHRVAQEGWHKTVQHVSAAERIYLPATLPPVSDRYRAYFLDAVAEHHAVHGQQAEYFTEAALLKDVTMADALAAFLDRHPDFTVLAIAGRFHVDYGIAIPALLQQRQQSRIQRITTMSVTADSTIDLHHMQEEGLADYICFFPPAPSSHTNAAVQLHLDVTHETRGKEAG